MITKPTLILNEAICKANIKRMAEKALKNNIDFRPHFKTHQSQEIGEWFRELGVTKITVSSIDMANYFAKSGWKDITIAFPINLLEIEAINQLADSITLNIIVESIEVIQSLNKMLTNKINAFVKINIGNNRAGIKPDKIDEISALLAQISSSDKIAFKGFLGHAGQSYQCRNAKEILEVHHKSISKMLVLKEHFFSQHPNLQLSVGDSPTCSVVDDFSKVDEFRPGVFTFYDLMQLNIGCCKQEDIAIAVACPVVAIHEEDNEVIIYGGSVHFSFYALNENNKTKIYGRVVAQTENGWGKIIDGVYIKKLSQEHGILKATLEFIQSVKIGVILYILPVHACTTANLYNHYTTTSGKKISRFRF